MSGNYLTTSKVDHNYREIDEQGLDGCVGHTRERQSKTKSTRKSQRRDGKTIKLNK